MEIYTYFGLHHFSVLFSLIFRLFPLFFLFFSLCLYFQFCFARFHVFLFFILYYLHFLLLFYPCISVSFACSILLFLLLSFSIHFSSRLDIIPLIFVSLSCRSCSQLFLSFLSFNGILSAKSCLIQNVGEFMGNDT